MKNYNLKNRISFILKNILKANVLTASTVNLDENTFYNYSKREKNLDDIYIYKENRKTLIEAIKRLDRIDREIVVRKYFLTEPSKEIARMLNITVNAVDLRVHRVLKELESELSRKK